MRGMGRFVRSNFRAFGGPRMATIVEFRRRLPQRHTSRTVRASGPADIVFFPGVRYEREQQPERQNSKKTKRRRDILQIEN